MAEIYKTGKVKIIKEGAITSEIYNFDTGKEDSITRPFDRARVTADDKEQFFSQLASVSIGGAVVSRKRGATDIIRKSIQFPKYKPAFRDLKVDSEGNIWVRPELAKSDGIGTRYDIFDLNGVFIKQIIIDGLEGGILPANAIMRPRGFWLFHSSPTEEPMIVNCRISG